jgi:branched-chain amino acid transport system ATP-binding protein
MGMVMDISDKVVVLNFGQVIAQGSADHVKNDPEVIKAYLGSGNIAEMRQRMGVEAAAEGP